MCIIYDICNFMNLDTCAQQKKCVDLFIKMRFKLFIEHPLVF